VNIGDAQPELLRDLDRDSGWTLIVEGAEQSYVDVRDATHLEFEYMQHIALAVDAVWPRPDPVRVLHLGGGACTLPRWFAATRPGSRQVVYESSAAILAAARPLGVVDGCEIVHGDAVTGLSHTPAASFDIVIWDLYDGPRVVTSGLTLAVVAAMRQALAGSEGIALLNVSDMMPFDVVRPVVAALRVEFEDVALVAEPSTLRGRRSGNCVLLGAAGALPVPLLRRHAASALVRGRVLHGPSLEAFVLDAVPPTGDSPLPEPDEASGRAFL
jgi:hypothetical protein